jgi:hypothetical protein
VLLYPRELYSIGDTKYVQQTRLLNPALTVSLGTVMSCQAEVTGTSFTAPLTTAAN